VLFLAVATARSESERTLARVDSVRTTRVGRQGEAVREYHFAKAAAAELGCYLVPKVVDEARAEFQKATTLDDLPWYISSLGYACAAKGDRAKAEQILQDLEELSKQRYVSPANRAAVYLGLGEKEKALDWLEKAYEDRDPIFWWIDGDQLYDSVRNEPRFQALVQKIDRTKAESKK